MMMGSRGAAATLMALGLVSMTGAACARTQASCAAPAVILTPSDEIQAGAKVAVTLEAAKCADETQLTTDSVQLGLAAWDGPDSMAESGPTDIVVGQWVDMPLPAPSSGVEATLPPDLKAGKYFAFGVNDPILVSGHFSVVSEPGASESP
jgi:hypothetical protein